MLSFLHIRNLATVSELEMEFAPGLNAITGETGTGKSLIMGALQALLGERTEKSIIRQGENRCEIAAELQIPNKPHDLRSELEQIIERVGAESCKDGKLLLRRVITPANTRAYINDSTTTLDGLKAIGNLLIDIHGPHDHQSLLNPGCQLELLDSFAELDNLRNDCQRTFMELQACQEKITELQKNSPDEAEREIFTHQLREIEAAQLDTEEEQRLHSQYQIASNARKLVENAEHCRCLLNENEDSAVEKLRPGVTLLDEISEIKQETGSELLNRIESIIEQIEELARDLAGFTDQIELNSESFVQIEERLELIQKLRRKYGGSINAVLDRAEQLRQHLESTENQEEKLKKLETEQKQLIETHAEQCEELSRRRKAAAEQLAVEIEAKLQNLGFNHCQFEIKLEPVRPGIKGADRAVFSFAPNPGEGIMPLRKIASSGEAARVMLGIKTVFSAVDRVPILIFDEVDANIGGLTANQVAAELNKIAADRQIFCITHLPQIAAAANSHYKVTKEINQQRTLTGMETLDSGLREKEIVRMMGGDEKSKPAIEHARNMIGNYINLKN